MTLQTPRPVLKDKKALVVGIANEHSIAHGWTSPAALLFAWRSWPRPLNDAVQKAPVGELVDIMDVGFACAFLATPYARRVTGGTVYVDGGVHIMA